MPRFITPRVKSRRAKLNADNPMRKHKGTIRIGNYKINRQHARMYSDARWKELRMSVLMDKPFCEACGEAATTVDHIIAHKGNWRLFLDIQNLQPLCKECHDKKSRIERKLPKMSGRLRRLPKIKPQA